MPMEVIVALLSLLGTLSGSYMGVMQSNRLVNHRIGELEKKVEKHNNFDQRVTILERDQKTLFRLTDENRDDIKKLEDAS